MNCFVDLASTRAFAKNWYSIAFLDSLVSMHPYDSKGGEEDLKNMHMVLSMGLPIQ